MLPKDLLLLIALLLPIKSLLLWASTQKNLNEFCKSQRVFDGVISQAFGSSQVSKNHTATAESWKKLLLVVTLKEANVLVPKELSNSDRCATNILLFEGISRSFLSKILGYDISQLLRGTIRDTTRISQYRSGRCDSLFFKHTFVFFVFLSYLPSIDLSFRRPSLFLWKISSIMEQRD